MTAPCRVEAPGMAELRRLFTELERQGYAPRWTAGGRGLVSDCPSCGGERALLVELPEDAERTGAGA